MATSSTSFEQQLPLESKSKKKIYTYYNIYSNSKSAFPFVACCCQRISWQLAIRNAVHSQLTSVQYTYICISVCVCVRGLKCTKWHLPSPGCSCDAIKNVWICWFDGSKYLANGCALHLCGAIVVNAVELLSVEGLHKNLISSPGAIERCHFECEYEFELVCYQRLKSRGVDRQLNVPSLNFQLCLAAIYRYYVACVCVCVCT